jgi:sigma-B regulation protein RsbU (phosphoserine phosphatase)
VRAIDVCNGDQRRKRNEDHGMKVLIAEDSFASRSSLESMLRSWNYDVVAAQDGEEAWKLFQEADAPPLAVLDWMMPGLDGLEVCRRVRAQPHLESTYLILLTARVDQEDIVAGLEGGADEYLTKPVNRDELRARVNAGRRIAELQKNLSERVQELEGALSRVQQLQGLLPICSYCKKIRDDQNYWQQVDSYITSHAGVQFSHGICPECYETVMREHGGAKAETP